MSFPWDAAASSAIPSNNFGSAAFRYTSVNDVNRVSGDVSAAQRTSWVAATAPPQPTGNGQRATVTVGP